VIDLHLHTTASDGKLAPSALVSLAARRGVRILSVTDHDTTAGIAEARHAAEAAGIRLIDGIEITAVEGDRDVHVLGYFFNPADEALARFLERQRSARVERVREMGARLESLNVPVDVDAIVQAASAHRGRSIGRPSLADALIAAGHAIDRRDAFDRLLATNRPAFVPRCGPSLADVVVTITRAGGIASLAHPGLLGLDPEIARFSETGLSALEVRHREHPPEVEAHYRHLAGTLGLAVSGGSDFHGETDMDPFPPGPGSVSLDAKDFAALEGRVRRGAAATQDGMHPRA
jgi:predicted metal-dependent phosphoesterase TrpH